MTFDEAFEIVIGHEGGYVDHPNDPGGATKYGISRRSYPGEDIAGMTLERAKAIYLRDFWGPAGCDAVPDALKFDLFDYAVNSGPKTAAKALQRIVGAHPDGIIGPRTLLAISSRNPQALAARLLGARLQMMTDLPTWPSFGRGWARRIADNLQRI
jgi:lysozyme family protein